MNRRNVLRLAAALAWPALAAKGRLALARSEEPDAFAQNRRLGRGVNVIGYDPLWGDRSKWRFRLELFGRIREAGFNHVRINRHPFRDNPRSDGHKLRPEYLDTMDWAVDGALAAGLLVILDFHEFTAMSKDPAGLRERFFATWSQIAERQKNRPSEVLFELLNEPHDKFSAELWNETLRDLLAQVRQTNPSRTVVVGPVKWNSIKELPSLSLPKEDRNLIATVHYYNPFEFTHQGAAWTDRKDKLGVTWDGTATQEAAVRADFDPVQAWSEAQNRPIYLGEFGAYEKGEMPSRVRWTNFVAREAERRGWSWAYWQFDNDFIVFDVAADRWIEPIRDALVPPTT